MVQAARFAHSGPAKAGPLTKRYAQAGSMLKILRNSIIVAVPFSLTAALLVFTVTSFWVAVFDEGTQKTYRGFEGVTYLIESQGLATYLLNLAPEFAFFFTSILLALITQGALFYRKPSA
jgi:hypothetical protein